MATNVPSPTFGDTGFSAPAESAILAGVQADMNSAFGGNLNPGLSTPQGQLASSLTAIIGEVNDTFLFVTNQFDPAFASGRYQDGLAAIYFITRNPAESTVVQAICSGAPGVVIPVGALAIAGDGNLYACTGSGIIPSTGSITLSFACNITGPIACPAGSLNQIYQAITGWDSINNPADGALGRNVESRAQLEARRQASVAGNSRGALSAVLGSVLSVPGVLQAYATENVNDTAVSIGGVLLVPHSLYVAVVGGQASAVAQAIWNKKAPGCNYNGNTSFTVLDTSPGYSAPFPSYVVTWQTPSPLPVIFQVNLSNNAGIPSNAATLIQNAIIGAFAGADGGSIPSIGSLILASRFYPPVSALGSWALIKNILVSSPNTAAASVVGVINGTTLSVNSIVGGTVVAGQVLAGGSVGTGGSGVVPGTTITSLGSGAGGTGTYNLSTMNTLGATFTATSGTGATITASAVTGMIGIGDILLNGTGIPANTTILSQISGAVGGSGVYVTSNQCGLTGILVSANVPISCIAPTFNQVQVNINQTPTINAANILVTAT